MYVELELIAVKIGWEIETGTVELPVIIEYPYKLVILTISALGMIDV